MRIVIQDFLLAKVVQKLLFDFCSDCIIKKDDETLKNMLDEKTLYVYNKHINGEQNFIKRNNFKSVYLNPPVWPTTQIESPQKKRWDIIFPFDQHESVKPYIIKQAFKRDISIATFGNHSWLWIGHKHIDGCQYIPQSKFVGVHNGLDNVQKYGAYIWSLGSIPLNFSENDFESINNFRDVFEFKKSMFQKENSWEEWMNSDCIKNNANEFQEYFLNLVSGVQND